MEVSGLVTDLCARLAVFEKLVENFLAPSAVIEDTVLKFKIGLDVKYNLNVLITSVALLVCILV